MKFPVACFLLVGLIACNNNKTTIVKGAKSTKIKSGSTAIKNPEVRYGIEGFYTGAFEATKFDENKNYTSSNKITISIDSIDDKMIYGHSVVAGNERLFSGEYSKRNGEFSAILKEPGDNKYDGVFTLVATPGTKKLKGTWTANDKDLPVTERQYELERQTFKYDPSLELTEDIEEAVVSNTDNEEDGKAEVITGDVLKVNASKKLLTSKDIENMYKGDLEVIRNAIYARHGYSFKNIRMRELFDNYVTWYMPVATDVSDYLTDIEIKNISLIKRYEVHATKYYDEFGR